MGVPFPACICLPLLFQPGPIYPFLRQPCGPYFWEVTILKMNLVWTPAWHSALQPRTPDLKRASAFQVAGTADGATMPNYTCYLIPFLRHFIFEETIYLPAHLPILLRNI